MKHVYHKNNQGYTLVEMLIAVVISTMLIAAASATYISQNRSYVAQESISEVNTQSMIGHSIVADAVRGAGFGIPDDLNENPINGYTTVITPLDSAASTDAITIVTGRLIGQIWPVGVGPGGMACAAAPPLTRLPPSINQIDIVYSGTERPNNTDKQNLSMDGIEFANATSVNSMTVTLAKNLAHQYPFLDTTGDTNCDTGRPVYLVEDVTFCVDANATLRRIRRSAVLPACTGAVSSDDEAIAENIEDFQLAYAVDADGDGQIDDLDGSSMLDDGDFVDGGAVADPATIRAVRINVLARTDKPDVNFQGLGSRPAIIENRPLVQVNDSFKRRWWQKIVKVRNQ
jgi:prepilin-type N-terminal cleavage/methylation domain-containing protein